MAPAMGLRGGLIGIRGGVGPNLRLPDPQASRLIGELAEVSFPPLELEVTDDFLALETHSRLATIFP